MKPYIAELLGTALFAFMLILSSGTNIWVSTVFAVFTFMYIVYGIGNVSGAHVNPAVTLGALFVRKIEPLRALYYILAQIAGASIAVMAIKYANIAEPSSVETAFSGVAFAGEIVGTALLAYGLAGIWFKKIDATASGFVAGLSLFAGIIISSLLLGGSAAGAFLNPAVAFGLNAVGVTSILGPILGAIVGAWTYVFFNDHPRTVWNHFTAMFSKRA